MRVTVQLRSGAHLKQRKLLFLFLQCLTPFIFFTHQNAIAITLVIQPMYWLVYRGITKEKLQQPAIADPMK